MPPTEIIPPGERRQRKQRGRETEIGRKNRTTEEKKKMAQKHEREKGWKMTEAEKQNRR